MASGYYREFRDISLRDYFCEIGQAELIPSRQILKEQMDERLLCLEGQGIRNLEEFLAAVKTPKKRDAFLRATGLPEEYLVSLKREIGGIRPGPVLLKDFPGIAADDIRVLGNLGIRDTRQLFDRVKTGDLRADLAHRTKIPDRRILELTNLTDVCRIRWVGANFARLLVDAGYDTPEKVAGADYRILYSALIDLNKKKNYFRGKFGAHDMLMCVQAAGTVPKAIAYD